MRQNLILDRIRKIKILPTFPYIVGEMLSIIEDPMSSASDLARHMDPSMVGEVLRIANTAYFGTRNFRNIRTIEQAIAVIGFQHLSYILLHMPFLSMVTNGDFNRRAFIEHSIACGILSRAISTTCSRGNPSEVYIAGIVHDIGIIIMYQFFKNEWHAVNRVMEEMGLSRIEAEREVFSVDHGYIGALLLEHWNIPKPITETVMFHHYPEKSPETPDNALVLHLGNRFVKDVDFKNDFKCFDDFMWKHRDLCRALSELGKRFSPSGEIEFLEKAYDLLKNLRRYIEDAIEADHDN